MTRVYSASDVTSSIVSMQLSTLSKFSILLPYFHLLSIKSPLCGVRDVVLGGYGYKVKRTARTPQQGIFVQQQDTIIFIR